MQSSTADARDSSGVLKRYARALHDYFSGAGEAALQRATELSREAIGAGATVLEVARVHHEQMAAALGKLTAAERGKRTAAAASAFCSACPASPHVENSGIRTCSLPGLPSASVQPEAAQAALRRINETLEQEARRIGMALHDEASQLMTVVHLKLADAARELPVHCASCFGEIEALLHQIEERLRGLAHELRPPMLDDLGLVAAMEFLAGAVSRRTGLAISVEASLEGRLAPDVEVALYRIVQESLNNAAKHARARRVTVRLEGGQEIRCSIRDDGVGFNVDETMGGNRTRGLGLTGIQERVQAVGGSLSIDSAANRGTEIHVSIPA